MLSLNLKDVIKEKVFGKTLIEHSLDKSLQLSHQQHNEFISTNRDVPKRLNDIGCFLILHELEDNAVELLTQKKMD